MKTRLGLAAAALIAAFGSAQATTLTLPPTNALTVTTYGDFNVYSLDLLQKCFAANDARCLPSGPYPVQSSPGQIPDQLIIYQGAGGPPLNAYDASGPFAGLDPNVIKVDNPFQAPTGNTPLFDTTAANEPNTFAGATQKSARWDASLASVLDYLDNNNGTRSDLVFLFDNNQQGADLNQQQFIWGQIRILDAAGNDTGICYELNTSAPVPGSNCIAPRNTGPNPNPLYPFDPTQNLNDLGLSNAQILAAAYDPAQNDYVGTVGRFCVSFATGASYNFGASNAGACNQGAGDYFVNNNLGTSNAEFAATVDELNNNLEAWAAMGWSMSINLKMRNLNDGGETLWICSDCGSRRTTVPEPGTLALVGMTLIGLSTLRRRQQRR